MQTSALFISAAAPGSAGIARAPARVCPENHYCRGAAAGTCKNAITLNKKD